MLSLTTRRLPRDWVRWHCWRPMPMEMHVNPREHETACYRAANWQLVCLTQARGDRGKASPSAIVHIKDTLDDNIELHRRMNKTLEATPEALFKTRFVEFDPLRAKVAGRGTGLLDRLADPFHEWLVDPEIGEVADGAQTFRLGQISGNHKRSVSPYCSPKLEYEPFSISVHDASQRPAIEFGGAIWSNKAVAQQRSIPLSQRRPRITRVWDPEAAKGQPKKRLMVSFAFSPQTRAGKSLLFALFGDPRFLDRLRFLVTWTSKRRQRVPPKTLKAHPLTASSPEAFAEFGETTGYALCQVLKNRSVTSKLAVLRDTLLPKLVSGDIRFPEASRRVGALA